MFWFPALAFAGILLLGFVRQPLLRALGRLLAIGVSAGFSVLAIGLYRLGDSQNWTGDGPGMLVVLLAVPSCWWPPTAPARS